jgi:hypothetical protein
VIHANRQAATARCRRAVVGGGGPPAGAGGACCTPDSLFALAFECVCGSASPRPCGRRRLLRPGERCAPIPAGQGRPAPMRTAPCT